MAKSKNGGTRAFIRGRIGSDVYSVGKNGKGQRQQVVRSLAEQVSNPRTQSQMFGRMVMSTVMQAVSALQPIIDHSFDGVAKGQPSISEFIRRNYALVKADAIANHAEENVFALVEYGAKGIQPGKYVISDGKLALDSSMAAVLGGKLILRLANSDSTVADLKNAFQVGTDGYLTFVSVYANNALYCRLRLADGLSDTTAITSSNVASLFTTEGNAIPSISMGEAGLQQAVEITFDATGAEASGVIGSDYVNSEWIHSACTLDTEFFFESASSDVVLPTYPTGTAQFLNGGDL